MNSIGIIGDVHGKVKQYKRIANQLDYSIQLGDMSLDYSHMRGLDSTRHKFLGGNHDNYNEYHRCPNSLGNYGERTVGGLKFFFVRGAFSIDKQNRQLQDSKRGSKTWWSQEQLSFDQLFSAASSFERLQPNIMMTHSVPTFISRKIGKPNVLRNYGFNHDTFQTNTQMIFDMMFEQHRPKLWIFGHFHQNKIIRTLDTTFICLDELSTMLIREDGHWNFLNESGNAND